MFSSSCGGDILLDDCNKTIILASPNYPNNYDVKIICEWVIKPSSYATPVAHLSGAGVCSYIHLEFQESIDLDDHQNCVYDRIEVCYIMGSGYVLLYA